MAEILHQLGCMKPYKSCNHIQRREPRKTWSDGIRAPKASSGSLRDLTGSIGYISFCWNIITPKSSRKHHSSGSLRDLTGKFPLEHHHPEILRANQIEDISHIISGKHNFCENMHELRSSSIWKSPNLWPPGFCVVTEYLLFECHGAKRPKLESSIWLIVAISSIFGGRIIYMSIFSCMTVPSISNSAKIFHYVEPRCCRVPEGRWRLEWGPGVQLLLSA